MITFRGDLPQADVLYYVASRVGAAIDDWKPALGAGVLRDGVLVGGVVYNNYHLLKYGSWCEISAATDDPACLTRAVLRAVFEYPFVQLGCSRLRAECAATNVRCVSLLDRLGFRVEGTARRAYDGEADSLTFSMLPEECRWVGSND